MINVTEMTARDLEIAYNRNSIMGEGDLCDEILAELDRRAAIANAIADTGEAA